MNKTTTKPEFEKAAYPAEFLDCLSETAFQTLHNYLTKAGAPYEVLDLLDCATVLAKQSMYLYHKPDGLLLSAANQAITEAVSDASLHIASLGGVFHAPMGTSAPRDITVQPLANKELEAVRATANSAAAAENV